MEELEKLKANLDLLKELTERLASLNKEIEYVTKNSNPSKARSSCPVVSGRFAELSRRALYNRSPDDD